MTTDTEKSEQLTHWKEGSAKSPYLGSWDLPGYKNIQLTIKYVKKEMTKGLKDNSIHNVAYFKEPGFKPMMINATNAKMLRALTGSPFIQKWIDIRVELRVEKDIKAFGAVHDGLRIVNKILKSSKIMLTKDHIKYEEIKKKLADGTDRSVVEKYYDLSKSGL